MGYATNECRKALKESNRTFDACAFVVRVKKGDRESELVADDVDHALSLSGNWIMVHNAEYVEIFRVSDDGSITPTIGAYRKGE